MPRTTPLSDTRYPSMALIFDALVAPVKLAVLQAAVELDLGHILTTATGVDEIAKKAGIQADTTGLTRLLDAMVSLGLAEKKNNKYSATDFSTHFLDKESPVYLGEYIQSMKELVHKNLGDMAKIVRNGPPSVPQKESWQGQARWEHAVADLALGQRAGIADVYADLVRDVTKYKGIKKILDLGGGPGLVGATILSRIPGAKGVLLDLPAVIGPAEKQIEKQGMSDRISFIAGDYNDVDLGWGYDLIWASHNLYFVKDLVPFFRRVKNALSDNGVFVCLHEGLTHEKTAPASIILMRLSSALEREGQDLAFDKGQIASCLEQAGFSRVDSRMVELPSGEAELVSAR